MEKITQLIAGLTLVALAGSGCATASGTGIKVKGINKAQTITAQVDLLEVAEVKKKEGSWLSAAKKPFVWIKENPKQTALGVGTALGGYFLYEELTKKESSSKPVALKGYTQNGEGNNILLKGADEIPEDLVQNGKNNTVTIEFFNEELEEE